MSHTMHAIRPIIAFATSLAFVSGLASRAAPGAPPTPPAVDIGGRLELFVDDHLVDGTKGATLRLHEPVKQPPARSPLPPGAYGTIVKDGNRYLAYYRAEIPGYDGKRGAANPGEITCCAESRDGIEWTCPDWGVSDVRSPQGSNVILAGQPPFSHNFAPFLDGRPGVEPESRFKALAGEHSAGLHAFKSADGLRWTKIRDEAVMKTPPDSVANFGPFAFDSQNVAFWSEAEGRYVCFFRTWRKGPGKDGVRRISRATSPDFVTWSPAIDTEANLPGEQVYTNHTYPYFRAPHIYIATPMRFTQGLLMGRPVEGNNGSSDILLMTMRAGDSSYHRAFREAFIRPGLDAKHWERKANSTWLNLVPTGPAEISIYHRDGDRYALRTDGFISVRAGADQGELLTKPVMFTGDELVVNFSTAAPGSLRVEIQDASGRPLPNFGLDDCPAIAGDAIEHMVQWRNAPGLRTLAGTPVRLRFELRECDLYSFRFRAR